MNLANINKEKCGRKNVFEKSKAPAEWLLRFLPALTARDTSKAAKQTAIQQQYLAAISINHTSAHIFWIVLCQNYIYSWIWLSARLKPAKRKKKQQLAFSQI